MIDRVIVKVKDKVYSFMDPLFFDETERPYKLTRISKELFRDTVYKCFTVITLEQIEVPTPQDFPML